MSKIPDTSVTLLNAVSSDVQHIRWTELYTKYEGPMRAFLHERFASLEPEDVMQETMIALTKKLPNYDYQPEAKGHFRNYLMGILKHKAQDALTRRMRQKDIRIALQKESGNAVTSPTGEGGNWRTPAIEFDEEEETEWRKAAMEVAINQLLGDKSINPLHRTVFRHVALLKASPETIAEKFGITRQNVYTIKNRMIEQLKNLVERLTDSQAGLSRERSPGGRHASTKTSPGSNPP